jgi:hypothetical protein
MEIMKIEVDSLDLGFIYVSSLYFIFSLQHCKDIVWLYYINKVIFLFTLILFQVLIYNLIKLSFIIYNYRLNY